MKYERVNLDEVTGKIREITEQFKHAASAKEQIELIHHMDQVRKDVDTMNTLAYIRNTINTKDEFYKAEREYSDEIYPVLETEFQEYYKALLGSEYREELERSAGKLMFVNTEIALKGFSPEVTELMQEESRLVAEYQAVLAGAEIPFDGKVCNLAQLGPYMQSDDRSVRRAAYEASGKFFDENQEKVEGLYDALVKNRTEQARKLGFDNYVELGYLRRGRNCYGPEDVEKFRTQVARDLVPIVSEMKEQQAKRIGVDKMMIYDDTYVFPDGNPIPQGTPDELLAAGKKMYTEMSPLTADFIQMMFDNDLFDVLAKPGKTTGGYCADIPNYNCPFIFSNFNGTAGDVDVLTHEAGHAFADYMASKEMEFYDYYSPTYEAAETHSMSMEFFATPWYELFFKEQTKKYEVSHLGDTLRFIPYGTMVDHFQHIVYENPEMTPAERNEVWDRLEKIYCPHLSMDDLPFYGRGARWQRQHHIYTSPFYYIDYCLAQTVALQFWLEIEKDWKAAWEKYLAFVKKAGSETFLDLVKSAGLKSPMEDGCVKEIAEHARVWLNEHPL